MSQLDDITDFLRAHVGAAQIIDTHISRVVIGAERAYKIKKPVAFSYVDFSTPEKRAAAAHNEIAINRRTAPQIYLGVRRVSRAENGALGRAGGSSRSWRGPASPGPPCSTRGRGGALPPPIT